MKKNIMYVFLIIVFVFFAILYTKEKTTYPKIINMVNYDCSLNRTINATFYKGKLISVQPGQPPIPEGSVKLILSDGRNITLLQTISADGMRYASQNESIIFWSKGDEAFLNEGATTTFRDCILRISNANRNQTGLPNPASQNCISKGGTIKIQKNKLGEYGICLFEDNRQCEEWALLRGECPIGGLKITGYDNDAEAYCAITGGKVEGVGTTNPMCKRIDGTYCNAQANFDGICPNPNDINPNAGNIEAI